MNSVRWTVQIKRSAKKELSAIRDAAAKKAITKKILALEEDAFPHGCRKIEGYQNTWRVRTGNFRIIYEVSKAIILIEVIKIADRKEAYRGI